MPSLDCDAAAVVRPLPDYTLGDANDRLRPLSPGTVSTTTTTMGCELITPEELWASLRHRKDEDSGLLPSAHPVMVLLDCRSPTDFAECHIRQAVHLSLPSIMLRRLAAGKVSVASVFKCTEARDQLARAYDHAPPASGPGSERTRPATTFVLCAEPVTSRAAKAMASEPGAPQSECQWSSSELVSVLYKTLSQDGCRVAYLQGGVEEFRTKYPEWCVIRKTPRDDAALMGSFRLSDLGSAQASPSAAQRLRHGAKPFRTSSSSSGPSRGSLGSRSASESEDEPYSALVPPSSSSSSSIFYTPRSPSLLVLPDYEADLSLGFSVGLRLGYGGTQDLLLSEPDADRGHYESTDPDPDPGFPVEILPHLFLGNAQNSQDQVALNQHQILNVVNVTPDLPNVFQDTGKIQYLQIPITDHLSQNLASHFPSAIAFIEEARERQEGVLVHCVGGISRSVTITVAYLMYKLSMTLNDAYDFVRRRKANISPNFNFMGQLLDFERQLHTRVSCTCGALSDPAGEDETGSRGAETGFCGPLAASATSLSASPHATLETDSALPSSVSVSPCSTSSPTPSSSSHSSASTSSAASPSFRVPAEEDLQPASLSAVRRAQPRSAVASATERGRNLHNRLRAMACQCQAAQCHFSNPSFPTESI